MQRQQIRVPTHKDVGTAVHGNLEKLVVVGIAARANLLHDLHEFDQRRQPEEERTAPFAGHVAIEPGREQRGHQSNGTATDLPSCKLTVSALSVTFTSRASGE